MSTHAISFLGEILFLLSGAILFLVGLRGRRVGTEPRCRRCGYMLVGLQDAERCPECGLHLSPTALVQGVRRRRWGMLAAGLLLLAIALLPLFGQVRSAWSQIDWHRLTTFGVGPDDAAPKVQLLDSAGMAEPMQTAIKPSIEQSGDGTMFCIFSVNALPGDTAFDVFARVPTSEREIRLGGFACRKGETWKVEFSSSSVVSTDGTVTLILRPRAGMAKGTVDSWSFCGGELIYPDVPVTQRK